jgi:hypothetical protein
MLVVEVAQVIVVLVAQVVVAQEALVLYKLWLAQQILEAVVVVAIALLMVMLAVQVS